MSGGRGVSKPPLTYEGDYDATRTYLPREVVRYGTTAYMATRKVTGVLPTVTASWLPLGGGGGAALLGVAGIFTRSANVTSDGSRIHFGTAHPSFDFQQGDHGMSVAFGDVIYAAGGKAGFYQASLTFTVNSVTNGVNSSDINQFMWEDGLFGKVPVVFASTPTGAPSLVPTISAGVLLNSELDYEPRMSAWCSGGVDRVYNFTTYLTVARWSVPA